MLTRRGPLAAALLALLAPVALLPAAAPGAPVLGFREDWNNGLLNGWGGSGGIVYSNPGTGGLANSGFLRVDAPPPPQHVGTRGGGLDYIGSWNAAGITQVRVWLSDLEADDPLEIHFSIGKAGSVFQYNPGFVPPVGGWAEFVVDLTDPADFTRIIALGSGTLAGALDSVDVVHFRHDLPDFKQVPDLAAGDFGIDGLLLTNGTVGVEPRPAAVRTPVSLAPPAPNPARGPVTLLVTGGRGADVSLRIVDAAGRRVREHRLAGVTGTRSWVWDLRDDRGRRVPAGVYRAIAASRDGGMGRPLVVVE